MLNRIFTPLEKRPFILVLVALALRLLFYIKAPHLTTPDVETYHKAGRDLFDHGIIEMDGIMPLFPLLNGLLGEPGIRLLGVLLSALTPFFAYLISLELFKNKRGAILAGLYCAFYPYYVYFSVIPLTENLFTLLFSVAIYFLVKRKPILTSVFFCLAILTRATVDLLAPFLIVLTAIVIEKESFKTIVKRLAIYGVTYCILFSPWWVHNYRKYDTFVRTAPTLSSAMYYGNINIIGEGVFIKPEGENFNLPPEVKNMSRIDTEKFLREKVLEHIRTQPLIFIKYIFIKVLRFWKPFPDPSNYGSSMGIIVVSTVTFLPLILLSIIFFFMRSVPTGIKLVTGSIPLYLTLIYSLTMATIRYRLPLDFLLMVLAMRVLVDDQWHGPDGLLKRLQPWN